MIFFLHRLSLSIVLTLVFLVPRASSAAEPTARWSVEKATAWQRDRGWLVGCNYAPAYAINQLEMWQAETFDKQAIERELGWAESLGFNSIRVFLHHLLWEQDARGFFQRMEDFLTMAERHHIGVMFVLFDGVWDPFPQPGPQRAPRPHVHNSGWVQSPGLEILKDPARHDGLKAYVVGVLSRFRKDRRIHAWDLFNEPDNINRPAYDRHEPADKAELAAALLRKSFAWARTVEPVQPLTAGVWLGNWGDASKLSPIERLMLEQSDVISFHNYGSLSDLRQCVENLRRHQRPILCTEYMARPAGSRFDPNLGYLKDQGVAAYNWGFVAGKTQTIYPWDSWTRSYTNEPPAWFHDIFHADGRPYDTNEVRYIQRVTGQLKASVP